MMLDRKGGCGDRGPWTRLPKALSSGPLHPYLPPNSTPPSLPGLPLPTLSVARVPPSTKAVQARPVPQPLVTRSNGPSPSRPASPRLPTSGALHLSSQSLKVSSWSLPHQAGSGLCPRPLCYSPEAPSSSHAILVPMVPNL